MDFLSNGFHQLYSELEDESSIWMDYTGVSTIADLEIENVNGYSNNNNNNNNNYSSHNSVFNSKNCDYYSYVDNNESFELSNFLINDYGRTFDTFSSDYENSLDCMRNSNVFTREQEWENNFLENYVELPPLTDLLPERTPLCNDSCNLFLKESSDNLIKFRPNCSDDALHERNNSLVENEAEKSFPCTFGSCNKVYAKPAHLKAHIRRHLGDKPYVCNWPNCSWKFSRSDELARHRRSHSGVKPYKCIYCTKCFSRSDHLAKHRKVHERKIAANKLKGIIYANIQNVKPGRKPRESKANRC